MKTTALIAAFIGAVAVSARPFTRRSGGEEFFTIDDSAVDYTQGSWTHLTDQGTTNFNGTLSYANGNSAYEFDFGGKSATSFAIYTPLKRDRGKFNVFRVSPDGHKVQIGTGDQYSSTADGQQASTSVFRYSIPANSVLSYRIENVPDDSRIPQGAYLSLDYINYNDGCTL